MSSNNNEKLEKSNSEEVPQQGETVEDADAQTTGENRKDSDQK